MASTAWQSLALGLAVLALAPFLGSCRRASVDPNLAVMAIESSPASLDPRVGTDAQSERIDGLLFDALVRKDEHFNFQPALAASWEQPNPRTWIFHLRPDVRFHDGRPLQAEDVAWTLRSMMDGSLVTAKAGAFAAVDRVEASDPHTLTIHLRQPDAALLFNLSDGLFGVVPRGAGRAFAQQPVGSGPFRFVRATEDKEVVVARNPAYWNGVPRLSGVRFSVIPDAITTALELEKGSADAESNGITLDMVHALRKHANLRTETGPSSVVVYLTFNVADRSLRDARVRQAIAFALNRQAIVDSLWRGQARLADNLLPPDHWARPPLGSLPHYDHDVARSRALLTAAGLQPDRDGVRLHLSIKTSTDETTRLMATILQQQLREVGIDLGIRSVEFGTFYADITRGAFQLYALRWIGSNEDPDIFRYCFSSEMTPPRGGNRGHFNNAEVDGQLALAETATDTELRGQAYARVQQIVAEQLPTLPLWYPNNEIVHTARLHGITPNPSGSFAWLQKAWIE